MKETITIKTFFHGWKEVDKEIATRWVIHMINGATCVSDEMKYEWISQKIKGITVEELLKGEKYGN